MHKQVELAIQETAKHFNIPQVKVEEIVKNTFSWTRRSMMSLEYNNYYLPMLGTFKISDKRYQQYIDKKKLTKLKDKESTQ